MDMVMERLGGALRHMEQSTSDVLTLCDFEPRTSHVQLARLFLEFLVLNTENPDHFRV